MVEVLDNACWHTSHHAVARNVFHHHGIGTDEHIVAHCDAANHFRTAAHLHVVAYYGSLQIMVKPYSDLLVYLAVFANPPPTSLVVISRVFFPLNHQQDNSFKKRARL